MAGETYGNVAVTFWTDREVKRVLTSEQKLLALYYFTAPHSNMAGLYFAPFAFTASLTGLTVEQVREWTLNALSPFVSYDEETEEVLVHRMLEHRVGAALSARDKRATAVNRIIADTHSDALVAKFLQLHPACELDRGRAARSPEAPPEAPSQGATQAIAVTEQLQEQEQKEVGGDARAPAVTRAVDEGRTAASAPADPVFAYVQECVRAANVASRSNPRIHHFRELKVGDSGYQAAADWFAEGIPLETAVAAIAEVAGSYVPTGSGKQIGNLKYFDGPVRNAHAASVERARAADGVLALVPRAAPPAPLRGALVGVEEKAQRAFDRDAALRRAAELVFAYWKAKTGQERAMLDDDRERTIIAALRQNRGDVGELLYVIDGAMVHEHFNGGRDGRKRLSISLLFGKRETVEELASSRKGYREGGEHPQIEAFRQALRQEAAA